ncbi:hypothetical protein BKP35_00795 [Anaerobacillus arseniciselenatis]|uniref:DUF4367 domain-containing protein n=1 Tax=Anaerobacillus arseniciselenatis TaxID=85682 RepID=A0A1S2LW41_9BACI|nr:hypothetical protein [Anaerobacillus arseniciselenatis]OIJ15565.1 hypothetical protein BKP35_00795 [Anaerobacillus arseniciselenatis]
MKMKIFLLVCLLISTNAVTSYANTPEQTRPFEDSYIEIGYKTLGEALDDFEQHFGERLVLPLRVPPVEFTHYFGRFNNLEGELNDSFEVEFINEHTGKNHYMINVKHIDRKLNIPAKYVINSFKLKDGSKANYLEFESFNGLIFEKGNWQYFLSHPSSISDKITAEILVEIANTI